MECKLNLKPANVHFSTIGCLDCTTPPHSITFVSWDLQVSPDSVMGGLFKSFIVCPMRSMTVTPTLSQIQFNRPDLINSVRCSGPNPTRRSIHTSADHAWAESSAYYMRNIRMYWPKKPKSTCGSAAYPCAWKNIRMANTSLKSTNQLSSTWPWPDLN